jgi:hypothetical protein
MVASAVLGVAVLACPGGAAPDASPVERTTKEVIGMKIRIEVDGSAIIATLNDSEAARDFGALLPLSVTLEDHASTEKVATLPRRLSTTGAPAGSDPDVGDIAYYAPWGNLAMYYRDFGYSVGLVKLGRIESGVERLRRASGRATIVRIEP